MFFRTARKPPEDSSTTLAAAADTPAATSAPVPEPPFRPGVEPHPAAAEANADFTWRKRIHERLLDTTRLYPGLGPVLTHLEPLLPLAVVTNKPLAPALRLLDGLGLRSQFVEVLGGDGPLPRKPDPAGVLSLAPHARGGPIVYVGDSHVDAETAARAGVPFVLAGYGFGATRVAPDTTPFVAATPRDLPRVIGDALRLGRLRD